ncbi:hypothetical protein AeMF1_008117, partial [Aphanomyces euteiches]
GEWQEKKKAAKIVKEVEDAIRKTSPAWVYISQAKRVSYAKRMLTFTSSVSWYVGGHGFTLYRWYWTMWIRMGAETRGANCCGCRLILTAKTALGTLSIKQLGYCLAAPTWDSQEVDKQTDLTHFVLLLQLSPRTSALSISACQDAFSKRPCQTNMPRLAVLAILLTASTCTADIVQAISGYAASRRLVDYTKVWTCVHSTSGFRVPLRIANDSNIECWSNDGVNCVWDNNCDTYVASGKSPAAPLVCGCMHKQVWGNVGYDDPSHWCSDGKKALGANPTNPNCTPAPTPVPTTTPAPTSTLPVTTILPTTAQPTTTAPSATVTPPPKGAC